MSAQDIKSVTRRLFDEAFNQHNPAVIDDLVAADYVDHSAIPAPAPGAEGFKKRVAMLQAAFDPVMTFGEFVAKGELVSFSWTMTGTHQGPFAGAPASGKSISVNGINIERFADGKVVEHWSQFDMVGLLRQIGVMPPPGGPPKS